MVDTPKTPDDFENMSDEDFLKLDENDYSGNVPEGETILTDHAPEVTDEEETQKPDDSVDDNNGTDGDELDNAESGADPNGGSVEEKEKDLSGSEDDSDAYADEGKSAGESKSTPEGEQSDADSEKEGKKIPEETGDVKPVKKAETPAKSGYFKLPEGFDNAKMTTAVDLYSKISTPFKADGKDFTIRSPEDAIRMMQQGVNYSRRMQELKPMKQLNRVLQDNGLADQTKLSFAIDLMKGDKAAITQLLKSHKIDPIDLDIENDSGYQAYNYAGNPQDIEFRDALDEALTSPDGQALVTHINQDWDKTSKARLREDPSILGNLQNLKSSGVYDKVVEELRYQKSMGYLTNIPFLQAFDEVGEAMKNAGVFEDPNKPAADGNPMASLQSQPQGQPVASGARKSIGMKKPETNPHLSSTPPSKQTGNLTPKEADFDKMSDEEFLKMAPPP